MPVSIQCPNPACAKVSLAPDGFAGRSVRCKVCGRAFVAGPTQDGGPADTPPGGPADDPFPKLPAAFGRYRILRRLGRGGMGAVYLAEDTALHRRVALKIPTFAADVSPKRVERFLREAQAAAGLAHPNVCTVFDVGRQNGRPFITMAFIDGKPLDAEIDPDRPMPERRAADLARTVARALQAAHDKGIVHRDLKPGNVMVTPAGEPVVMDFGLAKRVADPEADAQEAKLTHAGAVLGTPSYMAPEQVRGEVDKIGPAADVYALGVVLFELLTGRVPYRGAVGMVMGQILTAPVPPVAEFRPDADPRLAAICRRAMAKETGDRFPSMTAFAAALDEYLRPADQTAPTVTAVWSDVVSEDPPARSRSRSGRSWPLVAGGLVAVAAGVAAVFLLADRRPKPEPGGPVAAVEVERPTDPPPAAADPPAAAPVVAPPAEAVRPALPQLPDLTGVKPLFAYDFRDPKTTIDGKPVRLDGGAFLLRHAGANNWSAVPGTFGRVPDQFVVALKFRFVDPDGGALHWHFDARTPAKTRTAFKFTPNGPFVQQSPNDSVSIVGGRHFSIAAANPRGQFDEYTVVVRGRRAEVHLNGTAAGLPFDLPAVVGPADTAFELWRNKEDKPPVVEFASLTAWPLPGAVALPPADPPPPADPQAAALAALKADPNDPAANFARGKHLALTDYRWDLALAYLEKADAAGWKAAAAAEKAVGPLPGPLRAAGDAWWAVADGLAGRDQFGVRRHAADLYLKALPTTGGTDKEPKLDRVRLIYGPPDVGKVKPVLDLDFRKPADAAKVGRKLDAGATAAPDRGGLKVTVPAESLAGSPALGQLPKDFVLELVGRPTAANPNTATYIQYLGVRCVAPDLSCFAVRASGPPRANVRELVTLGEYERAALRHNAKAHRTYRIPHVRRTPAAADAVTVVVKDGWAECYLNGVLVRWTGIGGFNDWERQPPAVRLARPAESYAVELLFDNYLTVTGEFAVESLKAWPADGVKSFTERAAEGDR